MVSFWWEKEANFFFVFFIMHIGNYLFRNKPKQIYGVIFYINFPELLIYLGTNEPIQYWLKLWWPSLVVSYWLKFYQILFMHIKISFFLKLSSDGGGRGRGVILSIKFQQGQGKVKNVIDWSNWSVIQVSLHKSTKLIIYTCIKRMIDSTHKGFTMIGQYLLFPAVFSTAKK